MVRHVSLFIACLALAACGDSSPPKPTAGSSKPVRMACRTIDEAAMKAQDVTRKLAEGRKAGTLSQDEYIAYTNTVSDGLSAWAERQDLRAYCAALQRVVTDAAFQ
jgi:Tfp pilus assembly protein PilP